MCGLLGMFSDHKSGFFTPELDAFFGMLAVTALRGKDSTGLFGVTDENDVSWYKTLGNPFVLDSWDKIRVDFKHDFLNKFKGVVGHCRYATIGDVNVANAHPFQQENITLVHNGTIHNHLSLRDKFGGDVDSETICNMIHKIGIEETLNEISGAYALIYYDSDARKMFVVRNSQRELWIKDYNKGQSLIISSEPYTLDWGAARYKLPEGGKSAYFQVGRLYEFPLDNISCYKSTELKLTEKKCHVPSYFNGDWGDYDGPPSKVDLRKKGETFHDFRLGEIIDVEFNDAPLEDMQNRVFVFGKPFKDLTAPVRITTVLSAGEYRALVKSDQAAEYMHVVEETKLDTWQDSCILLLTSIPRLKTKVVGINYLGSRDDKFEIFVKPLEV